MDEFGKKIDELIHFDPLSAAEDITGKSYKEDGDTSTLGLSLHMMHCKNKEKVLSENMDSYFSISLEGYLKIIEQLGFVKIYEEKISKYKDRKDYLYCYFNFALGIFLKFDSYSNNTCINGGDFYYNWEPFEYPGDWRLRSSGCFVKDTNIWSGYHDCREAIRHKIEKLLANGTFITPWVEGPFYWIYHYGDVIDDKLSFDEKSKIFKELTNRRFQAFPEEVKKAILIRE